MTFAKLEFREYRLRFSLARFLVKALYWIASLFIIIVIAHAAFMDDMNDPQKIFNLTWNAFTSVEGFMKLRLFAEIATFPVFACLLWVSLIFLIYAVTMGIQLIVRSKEIIGALAVMACGFTYFTFLLYTPELSFSDYSSFSLTVIIMFIATGAYLILRDQFGSNLSMVGISLLVFGGEMIWPRHYQVSNHTLDYSGFWMLCFTYMALDFILCTAKDFLCNSEYEDG